jgi:hypothetical protein
MASVVVKNIGAVTDNLLLSVSDTRGWVLSLAHTVFSDVPPSETRTTTLSVTIPGTALPGETDEITVRVTSQGDPTKYDENKCWVTVAMPFVPRSTAVRSVTVEIIPENQNAELIINKEWQGKRYDPLSFKVKVTNTGQVLDKYVLELIGPAGWTLEAMPPELAIEAGKSDIAELSVSLPDNAPGGTTWFIAVVARGQLADNIGEDNDNAVNGDVAYVTVQVARGVRVDILTQDQTGTPGSKLVWIIRVKNLGNVEDTYNLSLDQHVWDNTRDPYDNWTGGIIDNVLTVPACSIGQAKLELWIDNGLRTGVRNDIVVTATSTDGLITDKDNVTAYVLVPGPRIPRAQAKVTVEAEVKAIELWPTSWDIGVLDEWEDRTSSGFTVRNVGNVTVSVDIIGSDAKSAPGEPATIWYLSSTGTVGVNTYAMWYGTSDPPTNVLTTSANSLFTLTPSQEKTFYLKLQAPAVITVPARMWTIVTLRAT